MYLSGRNFGTDVRRNFIAKTSEEIIMTYIQLVKTELTKLRRSHIFWILLAPVILLWIPSFLNADINFEATGISPENNFFIQSYLGFTWFMFPASLVVCTVLLTQSERTNKGLQKCCLFR